MTTPAQARESLWRLGQLRYLLLDHQKPVRSAIVASPARRYVLNISRRWGKSNLLCTLAVEQCLQKPGSNVRYAAGTSDMVEEIIEPHMASILDDCPDCLQPEFNATKWRWTFPNGSTIRVAGCDDRRKANRLRGRACDLAIIDEAGFIDDLDYVINDVLMPQLITTDGRMIISSTPPETPAHPFRDLCADAEIRRAYTKRTIHDATHISDERRAEFCEEAGGEASTTWKREYLCEFVTDATLAVFPEFGDHCVEERATPPHYVPIIVGDAGFHDFTFIVGGYHDFRAGLDVIEWEYMANKTLAREIDSGVSAIAIERWGREKTKDARRFIDAPAQIVAELSAHGSRWEGIAKTETDGPFMAAAINGVRQRMKAPHASIRIHPRCNNLIAHCRYGIWKKPGIDFERMDGFGHFDGCAALAYCDRLVDRRTDPYPPEWASMSSANAWLHEVPQETSRDNLRLLAAGVRGGR